MRQLVRTVIDDTLNALKAKGALSFEAITNYVVEVPRDAAHGDWSCNVAMTMSKATGKKPPELAEAIAQGLVDKARAVEKVEVVKNFLNFKLKDWVFQQVARDILLAGEKFGRGTAAANPRKILVEFVSANPTGPVHIGHARGSFMGDAVARLLEAAGHHVTREFYVNDFGNQVETLGRTIHKRYRELFGEKIELAPGEYPADYVIEIAKTWKAEVGDKYLKSSEAEFLPAAIAVGVRENLKQIRATLELAGIRHDTYFSEKSLHDDGSVRKIVDVYRERGATYEAAEARRKDQKVRDAESKAAQYADRQKGGTFLMTSQFKDDEDRIILRADGTPVYLTADLAYHKAKFDRGFDRMVDVFGADHAGHVPRIKAGVRLLGYDEKKLEFLLVQMVRITQGGEEVKVSKRKGTLFELSDLIEQAGADVCRFVFLSKTRDAQFDFDLDLVTKQSRENPVFTYQYGHARCASILKKAAEKGQPFVGADKLTDAQLAKLVLPEEKALLKKMSQLPDVAQSAAERLEPHHILYFCSELIGDFHSYYTQNKADPVINADSEKTQGRLAMVAALKHTIKSAFSLLGISAPEHMEAPAEE